MSLSEETYHLINGYINGKLKGRDLDRFKARMRKDDELHKTYVLQKEIITAIQEQRESELKAFIAKGVREQKRLILMRNKKIQFTLATASSLALIVAVIVFWSKKDSPIELANNPANIEVSASDDTSLNTVTKNHAFEPKSIDTQTFAIAEKHVELNNTESVLEVDDYTELEIIEQDYLSSTSDSIALGKEEIFQSTSKQSIIAKALQVPNVLEEKSEVSKDSAEKSDEEIVLKDEILASKYIAVSGVNLSYIDLENSSDVLKRSQTDSVQVLLDAKQNLEKESKKYQKRLKIEFWQSVVNFKGYTFSGNTIQLYGIESNENIMLKELDNRLYIRIDKKFYFLEKSKNHKRLAEVTNPMLLDVLQNE